MNIKKLLDNKKIKGLSGNAFKTYFILLNESKNNKIENFTILGLSKKWAEDKDLNMISGKNTIKAVIRELESLGIVKNNQSERILFFI